jgi:PAS domain S-box-containing protein
MLLLPDFRVRQRDLLLEISRAMTAQLDLSEVLRLVLKASVHMLAGRVAGFVALRMPDGHYRIRAIVNIDSEKLPQLETHLEELITEANEGVEPEHMKETLLNMAAAIDPALKQFFPMSLVIAQEPVGLLAIFRDYIGPTTPNDLQILQSFADQAAIAVQNAQLYEQMARERQRLDAFVRYSADGVMILSPELQILRFNHALERMTGWTAADAYNHFEDEVLVWHSLEAGGSLKDAIAAGWPRPAEEVGYSEPLYVEGDILRPDGMTLSIAITYAPLFSAAGELVNIIANVRDITNFRKAQELQNVFVSSISHELKTPVALIKGYAGTLRREDANWEHQAILDGLAVIEDEADRLTQLIENLLVTSKLQAERMRLNMIDLQLDLLAGEMVDRFRVHNATHTLVLDFPADFPVIQGDEERLRSVLDNLISNALKYSPAGGTVTVGGSFDAETVSVFVQDEGEGIAEQEQENIFERFYRVDGKLSRKTQGTGLGLYLAKAIIEAHNGQIHVKSQPGEGARFIFTLPR